MAEHTKQPGVLREVFEALGNDPFIIAECLARRVLADRIVTDLCANHKYQSHPRLVGVENWVPGQPTTRVSIYTLPQIEGECVDDTWAATSTTNAPDARDGHTAVWTGSEIIIWGGGYPGGLNTGGKYDPITDTWMATSTVNAPSARSGHTAVWTGSDMIVWG